MRIAGLDYLEEIGIAQRVIAVPGIKSGMKTIKHANNFVFSILK